MLWQFYGDSIWPKIIQLGETLGRTEFQLLSPQRLASVVVVVFVRCTALISYLPFGQEMPGHHASDSVLPEEMPRPTALHVEGFVDR